MTDQLRVNNTTRTLAMELAATGEAAMLAKARQIAREDGIHEAVVMTALMHAGELVRKDLEGEPR